LTTPPKEGCRRRVEKGGFVGFYQALVPPAIAARDTRLRTDRRIATPRSGTDGNRRI
jgi:hypothetical protein